MPKDVGLNWKKTYRDLQSFFKLKILNFLTFHWLLVCRIFMWSSCS